MSTLDTCTERIVVSNGCNGDPVFARTNCSYKNLSQQFIMEKEEYSRQFSHIYTLRLKKMRGNLEDVARKKWGGDIPILQLFELQEQEETIDKCILIGTLYKQQSLKPNIVKEISEEHQLEPQPILASFADDSDELVLEDEQQRITLEGDMDVQSLLTGVTCAVLGRNGQEGKFEVHDHCFSHLKEHVYTPPAGPPRLVVLVSGLGLSGSHAAESTLAAEMLLEWVLGEAGSKHDQESMANVARIILAGNSLQESAQECMMNRKLHSVEAATKKLLLSSAQQFDQFLVQLLESVDVDLMPGEFDPGNYMLPQQPLHRCMLPEAFRYPTMHSVSNPYQCEAGGRLLLGSSGQPLADMASLCRQEDRLALLRSCLAWGHISPTSPDTLASFPCYTDDPFIMDTCPDIFFAGNQPKFQTELFKMPSGQAVRLVCVPSFGHTQTCVVVNLHTLDCFPLRFTL